MGAKKPSQSRSLLTGLTEPQLEPIAERIAGEGVSSFRVVVEKPRLGHYGYGGDKAFVTFHYQTRSGCTGKETVFVKWLAEPGSREGIHYVRLREHGAPVPDLYGSVITEDGREMIFVELLDGVDDLAPFDRFMMDPVRFPQFLQTAARLNAIQPSDDYAGEVTQCPAPVGADWMNWLTGIVERIWRTALEEKLGTSMRDLCRTCRDGPQRLMKLAAEQMEPVNGMEHGLVHRDYDPDSIGFRKDTGEMLLVDLETIGFGRRFEDVAGCIAPPEDLYKRCLSRRDSAEVYMAEYVQRGGRPVPFDAFMDETRDLWIFKTLEMLWWIFYRALDGLVDWTENRDEGRQTCRGELHKQITALLQEA